MFILEFYRFGGGLMHTIYRTPVVPRADEFVNIEKHTYRVVAVTWAVDQDSSGSRLRANVELVPADGAVVTDDQAGESKPAG